MSQPRIAVVGNPNTGKSTLFNALTGLRQKVGNYPGVTVEEHVGTAKLAQIEVQLVDVPGTYSLAAHSPDEMLAIDLLTGNLSGYAAPNAVLIVLDASNLRRNLFFASQVLELGLPTVVALNMTDVARDKGVSVNPQALSELLGANVIEVCATKLEGFDALKQALQSAVASPQPSSLQIMPDVRAKALELTADANFGNAGRVDIERALIDSDSYAAQRIQSQQGDNAIAILQQAQAELSPNAPLGAEEARRRYQWIDAQLPNLVEKAEASPKKLGDLFDRALAHPLLGTLGFVFVMATVFQAVFAWDVQMMEAID
ncbi:MAG: 50S ribosome-binding GTPase [Gammaproteobacteria bacterium]|nr:50S ribosome-binding GTPase [Gammaproteobacteria bacterium]